MFCCSRNAQVNFVEKPQLKTISCPNYKHQKSINTVVNRALSSVPRLKPSENHLISQSDILRETDYSLKL